MRKLNQSNIGVMKQGKIRADICIHSLENGGAQHVVSTVSLHVPKDISLSISLMERRIGYPVNTEIVNILTPYLRIGNSKETLLNKLKSTILAFINYRKYIVSQKIDVTLSFGTLFNVINIFATRFSNTSCIVSIRAYPENDYVSIWLHILLTISLKLMKIYNIPVIVNAEGVRKYLIEKCNLKENKIVVIYNPKDIEMIRELALETINDDFFSTDVPILVAVGRLAKQKGYVHLIRIIKYILDSGIECRLAILGQGPLEEELKNYVFSLEIQNSVKFFGWLKNPYKYMKRATVFVMPSLFEGQPNSLIEALICGCPIVSTNCDSGPSEILENGIYGLLTQKFDGKIGKITDPLTVAEMDFYLKLIQMLENPELREHFSKLSNERVSAFAKENTVDKYYQVIRDLVAGRSKY